MCIFSGSVRNVTATKIFTRALPDAPHNQRVLVYQMEVDTRNPVAMVLPLPTIGLTIDFVNLEGYPTFFDDVKACAVPKTEEEALTGLSGASRSVKSATLPVFDVGSFIASFVPTRADFTRVDAKFRLSAEILSKLSGYRTYGFAVFQLKEGERPQKIHPMALRYTTADHRKLWFPTYHVHDTKLGNYATYHHEVYFQPSTYVSWPASVPPGPPASATVDVGKAQGLVDADAPIFVKRIRGMGYNADLLVDGYGAGRWASPLDALAGGS